MLPGNPFCLKRGRTWWDCVVSELEYKSSEGGAFFRCVGQCRELALFIDASENTPVPFFFEQIYSSTATGDTTYALPPQAVLQVYCQMEGKKPPPACVLCVRWEGFDLGAELTVTALAGIDVAIGV